MYSKSIGQKDIYVEFTENVINELEFLINTNTQNNIL